MYKSPIELLISDIQHQIAEQQDEQIYQAVVRCIPNIDKEELLRALKYDRNQYNKGHLDGYTDAMASIVRCKDCDFYCPETNERPICASWGSWCDPDGWCYRGERRKEE